MSIESPVAETESTKAKCRVIVFPLWRRVGSVRQVAMNLAVLTGTEEADDYRYEVADRFFAELSAMGVAEVEQDELVGAFFHQVELTLEVLYDDVSESAL